MRRILHHGPSPSGTPILLADRAVAGCWFELHRQGGCGAGELVLRDAFEERDAVEVGDWISFEVAPGERWYLGRVEERQSKSPALVRLRLEGMGIELNEVFPGGFGEEADGRKPHLLAATDLFSTDPDRDEESFDLVGTVDDVVQTLLEQYVAPATHITHELALIEAADPPVPVTSLKFRGEESVRAILKELAIRSGGASWGVDPLGQFFFLNRRSETTLVLREGRDLTMLEESRGRETLFNRLLLTGDYVYDVQDVSDGVARRSFRWRANYTQSESRTTFGERRLRIWIPWIRTQADAIGFVREFFRTYSQPASKYLLETIPQTSLSSPWLGSIRLENRHGETLLTAQPETIRVQFDHAPRFRLELGPIDPRELWPEPPQDERWELQDHRASGGGDVTLTDFPTDDTLDPSGGGSDDEPSSTGDDDPTSDVTSGDVTSLDDSDFISGDSSLTTSAEESLTSDDSEPDLTTSEESGADSDDSLTGDETSPGETSDGTSSLEVTSDPTSDTSFWTTSSATDWTTSSDWTSDWTSTAD
jgi:hypothetical protein